MKRTFWHRLLFIPSLCLLIGSGCATKDATKNTPQPEQDPVVTTAIQPDAPDSQGFDTQLPDNRALPETDEVEEKSNDSPLNHADDQSDAQTVASRPTFKELHPCVKPVEEAAGWLDRSHIRVFTSVCSTVAWFDGFFGDEHYDAASRQTFGRIGLSGFWDQRDGFDPSVRFRAKLALPALSERANITFGRGDESEFVEEKNTTSNSIPSNFNKFQDDSFLIGLGYQRDKGLKTGYSFSVGVKLHIPPEPYVKAKYRRSWELTDSTLFQIRPVAYWKLNEGFGTTVHMDVDQMLSTSFMLRFSNNANISQDNEVEGVAWSNWLSLFQALANRKAISYNTFIRGETEADVRVQNYGFEVRFRRRIAREWLFLELVSSVTWPREFLEERRESNLGVGIGFEMYFGPVPEWEMR